MGEEKVGGGVQQMQKILKKNKDLNFCKTIRIPVQYPKCSFQRLINNEIKIQCTSIIFVIIKTF